jgi:CRP-like cAMP-binding protein
MQPLLIYEAGMYFGELALLNKKPRAGTILTLTDCFFAVVDADVYERLLKKDTAQ